MLLTRFDYNSMCQYDDTCPVSVTSVFLFAFIGSLCHRMEHFRSVVPEKLLSKSYASPTHVSLGGLEPLHFFSYSGQESRTYLKL